MNSIESNFVPYQIALDMKSIGFNEPCFGYWNIDPYLPKPTFNMVKPFDHEWCVPAPLYQQAFSFFRKKYGLYVIIDEDIRPQIKDSNGKLLFEYTKDGKYAGFEYEEAELACLIKLIEIVKNK